MVRWVMVGAGGVYDLGYHVVWCSKYRRRVLAGSVITLDVMPDHVYLSVRAHSKHSLSYVANQLKGFSSYVLRAGFGHLRSGLPILWLRSYVVAAVGVVSVDTVRRYVDTRYEWPWGTEYAW
ncbi:IS200/IS605 family transposase [Parafrankia soli]|uniref:IS200/IS605 family transposase n=1 Tax=Parafrankia soli TaxID=2599596 RepID=UPI003B58A91F